MPLRRNVNAVKLNMKTLKDTEYYLAKNRGKLPIHFKYIVLHCGGSIKKN